MENYASLSKMDKPQVVVQYKRDQTLTYSLSDIIVPETRRGLIYHNATPLAFNGQGSSRARKYYSQ